MSLASCVLIYFGFIMNGGVRVVNKHFVIVFLYKNKDEYTVKLNKQSAEQLAWPGSDVCPGNACFQQLMSISLKTTVDNTDYEGYTFVIGLCLI